MKEIQGRTDGQGRAFTIIVSRFNEDITEALVEGARACLLEHGVREEDLALVRVPGAYELPAAAAAALARGGCDGVVALGCVIRGETTHYDYVAGEAARGLQDLAFGLPAAVGFGLLTTEDREQALARAGGAKGNKGREAALTALEMADLLTEMRSSARPE